MPRFFIDTSDQRRFIRDDVGIVCEDAEAAKTAAVDALPDMARQELPDGDQRMFLAIVRGEDGSALLQCALSLTVTSLVPTPTRQGAVEAPTLADRE